MGLFDRESIYRDGEHQVEADTWDFDDLAVMGAWMSGGQDPDLPTTPSANQFRGVGYMEKIVPIVKWDAGQLRYSNKPDQVRGAEEMRELVRSLLLDEFVKSADEDTRSVLTARYAYKVRYGDRNLEKYWVKE